MKVLALLAALLVPAPRARGRQRRPHTSGLVDSLGGDDERLTRVDYSLLAVVVERASGTPYERFLRRHLFRPPGCAAPATCCRTGRRASSRPSTTRAAGRTARRSTTRGRPAGPGGTCAATAARSRPVATWLAGSARSRQWTVLDRSAQREVFEPRAAESENFDYGYGDGWVLFDTPLGRIAWHHGGNGRSYAELARVLGRGTMVFWATNQVRSAGRWDRSRLPLTGDTLEELLCCR